MSNVIDTLIFDRTEEDVKRVAVLQEKALTGGWAALTAEEKAEWLAGMRGAYNATDMNRVGEAVAFLAGRFHDIPDELAAYRAELGVASDKIYLVPYDRDKAVVTPKTDWKGGDTPDTPTDSDVVTYLRHMKDTIIKQTGNSRLLKSSLPAGTTWEEALAQLQAGTFPIDLLGLQDAGVEQLGTALSKDNLLTDEVAAALGLGDTATPNDALNALSDGLKTSGPKYGTCSTASDTAAKVSALSGFTLSTGAIVSIKFSAFNTAASPTLNVNNTGAKPIYDCRTNNYPGVGAMLNGTHNFVYNGSQWVLLNPNPSSKLLRDLDWSTIKMCSDQGIAASLFAVGDTKSVALSGTVGARTFSNETYYCFILGFNHNSDKEGNNAIHFQFGKTAAASGVDVAFTDSFYNSHSSATAFCMNPNNTNVGGWKGSYMRNTIIPAFKSALPSTLQNVLKSVTKYTDNTGNASGSASNVTATSETLFLLAEWEVQGARTNANSTEQVYQRQYDYYRNGNSQSKFRDTDTTVACMWWCRSPKINSSLMFCSVINNTAGSGEAYLSFGFAPGFCV